MSNSWIPDEAKCKGGRLHDFRQTLRTDKDLSEVCHRCGKCNRWKLSKGKVLNEEGYISAHMRDFLQPQGFMSQAFVDEYGQEAYDRARPDKPKESTPSLDDIVKDAKKEIKNPVSVPVKETSDISPNL